jgi:hypothetical protein
LGPPQVQQVPVARAIDSWTDAAAVIKVLSCLCPSVAMMVQCRPAGPPHSSPNELEGPDSCRAVLCCAVLCCPMQQQFLQSRSAKFVQTERRFRAAEKTGNSKRAAAAAALEPWLSPGVLPAVKEATVRTLVAAGVTPSRPQQQRQRLQPAPLPVKPAWWSGRLQQQLCTLGKRCSSSSSSSSRNSRSSNTNSRWWWQLMPA